MTQESEDIKLYNGINRRGKRGFRKGKTKDWIKNLRVKKVFRRIRTIRGNKIFKKYKKRGKTFHKYKCNRNKSAGKYYRNMFTDESPRFMNQPEVTQENEQYVEPIKIKEVKKVIKSFRNGKRTGPGIIPK